MFEKEDKGCNGYRKRDQQANVADLIAAQTLPENTDWQPNVVLVGLWKALNLHHPPSGSLESYLLQEGPQGYSFIWSRRLHVPGTRCR